MSGSADLHGSNKNYINGGNNFGNPKIKGKSFAGRNFYFGIREHAMGTMVRIYITSECVMLCYILSVT